MTIDRARVRSAFLAYTAGYNAQDPKVALKLAHTWRVAALCERIARSLALPAQDVDLAWLSGVLHDVGRFEQLRRYGTFNDAVSIDHALCSTQVLFEQGHIRSYLSRPEDLLIQEEFLVEDTGSMAADHSGILLQALLHAERALSRRAHG